MKHLIYIIIALMLICSCSKEENETQVFTYSILEYQANDTTVFKTYCLNGYTIEINYDTDIIIYTIIDPKDCNQYVIKEPFKGNTNTTFEHSGETFKVIKENYCYIYSNK